MIYQSCKVCGGAVSLFHTAFELLECNNCGLIFYKHQLDSAYVKELYDKLYNQSEDYSEFKNQAAQLQAGTQPHLGYNKNKILRGITRRRVKSFVEVGAGVGIVGNYLQKRKFVYDGIELDAEAARLAKTANINIVNESFHYLTNYHNKDAVISFEVLEHIDDLQLAFKLINQCLKPGGYLGFSVPNFTRYYNVPESQRGNSIGQAPPPVHINFFTVENLRKIVTLFGFEVLHLRARAYPSLSLKTQGLYKKLLQSAKGQYHGATILCIAKKRAV